MTAAAVAVALAAAFCYALAAALQQHAAEPVLGGITAAVVIAAAFGGRRLPTGVRAPVYAAGAGALFGVASALVRLVAVRLGDMTQLHALVGPTVILVAAATPTETGRASRGFIARRSVDASA